MFICAHTHNCEQCGVTKQTQRVCQWTNGGERTTADTRKHANSTQNKLKTFYLLAVKCGKVRCFCGAAELQEEFLSLGISPLSHLCDSKIDCTSLYPDRKTRWTPLKINVVAISLIIRPDFLFGASYLAACPQLCLQSSCHFGLFSYRLRMRL